MPNRDDSEFRNLDRPNDLELAMAAAWDPEELGTGSVEESIADTLDAHESMGASLSDESDPPSLDLDSVLPWTCEFLETLGSGPHVAQDESAAPDAGSVDTAPGSGSGAIVSDPGTVPYGWESIEPGHESIPEGWGEVGGSESLPVKSSRQVAIDCGKSLQRLAGLAATETERRDMLRKARAFYLDAGLTGMAAWCERHIGS